MVVFDKNCEGQSLDKVCDRHLCDLSMATKDSAGTLPVNSYETKAGDPKPVDVARLALTEEEISSDQSSSPGALICGGTIVCVRKGSQPAIRPSPFYLAKLDENMYAVEEGVCMLRKKQQKTMRFNQRMTLHEFQLG